MGGVTKFLSFGWMEEIGVTDSFIWMDGRNWGLKILSFWMDGRNWDL
jgi:hypothetical protein